MTKKPAAVREGRDGFVPASDERAEEHEMLSAVLDEFKDSWQFQYFDLKKGSSNAAIRNLPGEGQCRVITAALERMEFANVQFNKAVEGKPEGFRWNRHHDESWRRGAFFGRLVDALLRKKLPVPEDLLTRILEWGAGQRLPDYPPPYVGIVKAIENFAKTQELTSAVTEAAEACRQRLLERNAKDERKFVERLDAILGTEPEVRIAPGEAWSDAALNDLAKMDAKHRRRWIDLLTHCLSATGGSPKEKWLDEGQKLVNKVTVKDFKKRLLYWFPLVDKPRTDVIESWSEWVPNPNLMIIDQHGDLLKGLVWCCSQIEDDEIARTLTALAISAYKKVPGIGPRAVKLGNACVYTLGAMPGTDGVGQLAILKVRVKFGTAQKGIEKALVRTAERVGIPREELEEMSVPAYGLTDVGARSETLGDFTAELEVVGRKPELRWRKPDGKLQKSIPAAVKRDFGDELKELKHAAKDIENMLPAQVARIEQKYLERRDWKFPVWRERYLDHPLVGVLARRLIWRFRRGSNLVTAIWSGDGFVDQRDKSVSWLDTDTTVELWHPLDEETDRVVAWREWLLKHEVRQPFKQAHREVYVLTDAERKTRVYSNRFASHVLKQHQLALIIVSR